MATLAKTSMTGSGIRALVVNTLTSSDDFVYDESRNPVMNIQNTTGGSLTLVIDGAGGTTIPVAGYGPLDVSGGYSTGAIADGTTMSIPLNSISAFLQGAIVMTGGTGLLVSIQEF